MSAARKKKREENLAPTAQDRGNEHHHSPDEDEPQGKKRKKRSRGAGVEADGEAEGDRGEDIARLKKGFLITKGNGAGGAVSAPTSAQDFVQPKKTKRQQRA